MKTREVSGLQGASQNVGLTKYIRVLFIDKTKVLLGHVGVLDRRPTCARAHQIA
jgi:hypothetical protein